MKNVAYHFIGAIPPAEWLLAPPAGALEALSRRADGDDERMLVGMVQLQRVMSEMHSLAPELAASISTRLRYLLGQGFPQHYKTPKGGRTNMDVADVLRTVFGFELLAFGVGNAAMSETVKTRWSDTIARGVAAAWHSVRADGGAHPGDPTLLLLRGVMLREATAGEVPFAIHHLTESDLDADGARRLLRDGPFLVIDLADMVRRFVRAVQAALVATAGTTAAELDAFAAEVFGSMDPDAWRVTRVDQGVPA